MSAYKIAISFDLKKVKKITKSRYANRMTKQHIAEKMLNLSWLLRRSQYINIDMAIFEQDISSKKVPWISVRERYHSFYLVAKFSIQSRLNLIFNMVLIAISSAVRS